MVSWGLLVLWRKVQGVMPSMSPRSDLVERGCKGVSDSRSGCQTFPHVPSLACVDSLSRLPMRCYLARYPSRSCVTTPLIDPQPSPPQRSCFGARAKLQ
ncbi:hypothetical protein DFH06DRAFT_640953 [Mycena polygramma]|nr:hypothetical protein DFH06DRAFT_640953 [Mycena polygramma]